MKKTKIFVYGTLLNDDIRESVCRSNIAITKKVLLGYKKKGLNILVDEDNGSNVDGGVIEVNNKQLGLLDYYESLGELYKIIDVYVDGETVKAYQLID